MGDSRLVRAGQALQHAVDALLGSPQTRTADPGGTLGTQSFGDAVARRVMSDD